ncbi:MAG: hypothetical protein ACYC6G_18120 [Desulfobaccales bacterium]
MPGHPTKISRLMTFLGLSVILCILVLPARADVVNFQELLSFIDINIPGWAMVGKPCGTTRKQDKVMVSEARVSFRAGDMAFEVIIMDFQGKPIPFLTGQQPEIESAEATVHTTEVQGFRALETYRQRDRQGDLNISVADRFWVKLDGEGIDNLEVLKTAAQQIDLKRLATLAK